MESLPFAVYPSEVYKKIKNIPSRLLQSKNDTLWPGQPVRIEILALRNCRCSSKLPCFLIVNSLDRSSNAQTNAQKKRKKNGQKSAAYLWWIMPWKSKNPQPCFLSVNHHFSMPSRLLVDPEWIPTKAMTYCAALNIYKGS